MRTSLFFSFVIGAASSLMAAVITPEQALDRMQGSIPMRPSSAVSKAAPRLVSTFNAGNQPAVYVFTTADSTMMLLSADDRAASLLGYSMKGTEINPTLQWWINEYSREIEWMRQHSDNTRTLSARSTERASISPMISTTWDQGEPYNNMCPTVGSQHCVTGCAATALAQVLKYHSYPATNGTGTSSYDWNGTTLSFDFASEAFDWDNMLDSYDGAATDTEKSAVAKLMYACGVMIQMVYGTGESGGYPGNAIQPLIANLGYDKAMHMEYRMNYGRDSWDDLVYNEMVNCGPVHMSGFNDGGGHSFVIDGYSANGYFHVNWGWGGMSDGYFLLSVLEPGSQGIGGSSAGYAGSQYIMAGLRPAVEGSRPHQSMSVYNSLGVSSSSAALGSTVYLTGGFFNLSGSALSGQIGYGLTDSQSGNTTYHTSFAISLPSNYGYDSYSITLPVDLAEGTYQLKPAWCDDANVWHDMLVNISGVPYIDMRVEGTTAYFTVNDAVRLNVTDIKQNIPIFLGLQSKIEATLTNISTVEYWGNIRAFLTEPGTTTPVAAGSNFMVDLLGGESTEFTYDTRISALEGQTVSAGSYDLYFCDEQGRVISSPVRVEVKDAPAKNGSLSTVSVSFNGNSNSADAEALDFTAEIRCTSGTYVGKCYMFIFPENGGSSSTYMLSDLLYIQEGETANVHFRGSFPSLAPGNYFVLVYDENINQVDYNFCRFTIAKTSAIEGIDADCEVVSIEYYDLTGRRVDADSLTPGIYIVAERHADGTVRTSKKLVK